MPIPTALKAISPLMAIIGSAKGGDSKKTPIASPSEFSHGGKVKRTGKAKVHKGERVLTKKQARKYESRKR